MTEQSPSLLTKNLTGPRRKPAVYMNQKELKELIEFLIEKDIAEFELERGDVRVKIKRGAEHLPAAHEPRYIAVPSAPAVVAASPVAASPAPPASARVDMAASAAAPEP